MKPDTNLSTHEEQTTSRQAIAALVVIVVGYLIASLPDYPGAFHLYHFLQVPLEIPLLLLVLLLVPKPWAKPFAAFSTLALFTLLFLKIADIGVQSAFLRPFNPHLDIKMIGDGWNLLSGTIGTVPASVVIVLVAFCFLALGILFYRAQCHIADYSGKIWRRTFSVAVALLVGGSLLWAFGPVFHVRANLQALPLFAKRLVLVEKSIKDMRKFEKDLTEHDEAAHQENLFSAVKGRDVILIFIESYGRSAVEDPLYAPLIKPRLEAMEAQLSSGGFNAVSAWVKSPTMGGLSWLAHGTFLSGLWIDSQARYDRLMMSDRQSLNALFQEAGWRTAAIMPAITMEWPEADYFGYDQVLVARDLEYRGDPFNWVTMPDQYTLSAFERLARAPANKDGHSVMAEIALISSHAPWTPVPSLIDWQKVGDGTAFNEQAHSDKTPREVWADRDSIRDHYIRTIDYSLQTVGDYIARFGKDAVFIILGDHQPAPLVTGDKASRAVPIHIISRDGRLTAAFTEDGFTQGMAPVPTSPELLMDTMRERLIRHFSLPAKDQP